METFDSDVPQLGLFGFKATYNGALCWDVCATIKAVPFVTEHPLPCLPSVKHHRENGSQVTHSSNRLPINAKYCNVSQYKSTASKDYHESLSCAIDAESKPQYADKGGAVPLRSTEVGDTDKETTDKDDGFKERKPYQRREIPNRRHKRAKPGTEKHSEAYYCVHPSKAKLFLDFLVYAAQKQQTIVSNSSLSKPFGYFYNSDEIAKQQSKESVAALQNAESQQAVVDVACVRPLVVNLEGRAAIETKDASSQMTIAGAKQEVTVIGIYAAPNGGPYIVLRKLAFNGLLGRLFKNDAKIVCDTPIANLNVHKDMDSFIHDFPSDPSKRRVSCYPVLLLRLFGVDGIRGVLGYTNFIPYMKNLLLQKNGQTAPDNKWQKFIDDIWSTFATPTTLVDGPCVYQFVTGVTMFAVVDLWDRDRNSTEHLQLQNLGWWCDEHIEQMRSLLKLFRKHKTQQDGGHEVSAFDVFKLRRRISESTVFAAEYNDALMDQSSGGLAQILLEINGTAKKTKNSLTSRGHYSANTMLSLNKSESADGTAVKQHARPITLSQPSTSVYKAKWLKPKMHGHTSRQAQFVAARSSRPQDDKADLLAKNRKTAVVLPTQSNSTIYTQLQATPSGVSAEGRDTSASSGTHVSRPLMPHAVNSSVRFRDPATRPLISTPRQYQSHGSAGKQLRMAASSSRPKHQPSQNASGVGKRIALEMAVSTNRGKQMAPLGTSHEDIETDDTDVTDDGSAGERAVKRRALNLTTLKDASYASQDATKIQSERGDEENEDDDDDDDDDDDRDEEVSGESENDEDDGDEEGIEEEDSDKNRAYVIQQMEATKGNVDPKNGTNDELRNSKLPNLDFPLDDD